MVDRSPVPVSPTVAFAGATLDRATHLRDDADRLRQHPRSQTVLVGPDQDVAVSEAGALALTPAGALPSDAALTFLGLAAEDTAVFAFDAGQDGAPGARFASLRALATDLEPSEAALAAYAVGMIGWHRVNRHCGRCGYATLVDAAGHRRRCPNCGLLQFPRTDPAVTMLVQTEDRCLLSRRVGAPENRWSALAGFMEPGETPEEAVVREAREETGVKVVAVDYVTSQPWPFPAALMIGFWAFADPLDRTTLAPEPGELLDVRWWPRSELRRALDDAQIILPPAGSIGNYLISTWLAGG